MCVFTGESKRLIYKYMFRPEDSNVATGGGQCCDRKQAISINVATGGSKLKARKLQICSFSSV